MIPAKFLFLLLLFGNCCSAQLSQNTLHFDTLEGVFKKSNQSKDGYNMNGTIFDIPDDIASKCNNKRIRLLGQSTSHFITAGDLKIIDSKGKVEYKQGREGEYSTYEVHSIYVFEAKKKTWALIYNQQEDN